MFKNVASQKLSVYVFDSTTSLPKTGDAANLTAYVNKDYAGLTVLGDTSATEVDATNGKGFYIFDLTQGETNADILQFACKSATSNMVAICLPAVVFTRPPNFTTTSIDSSGRLDVIKVAGTSQTARDLGASVLLSSGTGTGQLDFTSGIVKANATQILGTAVSTPATAGILDVNLKNIANAAVSTSTAQLGVNAVNLGGTAQTGRDVGLSVLVAVGTGTGQINLASGKVPATIAAGDIAASAITASAIAADAITAAKIADGAIDAATFAAGAINAAAIAADAITDAKVASDVTIASVTGAVGSVTGAVGSVTGAVGSVTGNVGGNVTGSVGSIASGGIAAASFAAGAIDAAAIATDAIGSAELAASAVTEIQSGLSTLDAAAVRTAVGLASANLDTQLAAIAACIDTEIAAIKTVTDQFTAAQAEPSSVPAANATPLQKIAWIAAIARNKITQTATTQLVRNDGDSATIGTSTVSDDATTFVRGKFA